MVSGLNIAGRSGMQTGQYICNWSWEVLAVTLAGAVSELASCMMASKFVCIIISIFVSL